MPTQNLVDSDAIHRGADQILTFDLDPRDTPEPTLLTATFRGRFGPDDNTSSYFAPEVTPTIDENYRITVPITRAKSFELSASLRRVKFGVWTADSGNQDALVEVVYDVVNLKGQV